MIKMNFENKSEGDDKQLIQLLKEEIKEFPSDELVQRSMIKISAMQAEKRFLYKPLKTPLYIMAAVVFLLLIPFLIPMASNSLLLNPLTELLAYPEISILESTIWCWLAMVVLGISRLLFQTQSRLNFNSFKR